MEKAKKEHERNNASPSIFPEYQLWEDHWIRWDFKADIEQVFLPCNRNKIPCWFKALVTRINLAQDLAQI